MTQYQCPLWHNECEFYTANRMEMVDHLWEDHTQQDMVDYYLVLAEEKTHEPK